MEVKCYGYYGFGLMQKSEEAILSKFLNISHFLSSYKATIHACCYPQFSLMLCWQTTWVCVPCIQREAFSIRIGIILDKTSVVVSIHIPYMYKMYCLQPVYVDINAPLYNVQLYALHLLHKLCLRTSTFLLSTYLCCKSLLLGLQLHEYCLRFQVNLLTVQYMAYINMYTNNQHEQRPEIQNVVAVMIIFVICCFSCIVLCYFNFLGTVFNFIILSPLHAT